MGGLPDEYALFLNSTQTILANASISKIQNFPPQTCELVTIDGKREKSRALVFGLL